MKERERDIVKKMNNDDIKYYMQVILNLFNETKRILTHSFSEEKIKMIVQKTKKEACVFPAMINR